jgi:hypothetical protein
MVRMMSWSEALPGKVQQRTGMPSRCAFHASRTRVPREAAQ